MTLGRPLVELVVVGTSWGGLAAVARLLDALPTTLGASVAVVQHMGARESALAALLRPHTRWPVTEVDDKERITPGRVHIAPPGYHLLVEGDRFALSTEGPVRYSRPSIDVFFYSAADAYRERVAGVLLTGANDDGARGLAYIQRRGGRTLVQDPATATRPDMPAAALSRFVPDVIGSIDDIAAALATMTGSLEPAGDARATATVPTRDPRRRRPTPPSEMSPR